ncbi:MAG TPA: hypothetical protein VMT95_15705 [Candidatus Binatia bacterium]|nr:hypothetical protein [Candidatus Binatia bacterium]
MPQTSAIATHTAHGTSWMLPEAKRNDLLYLAGNDNETGFVYTYPAGKPVGALTGIVGPQYECADKKGDIFIAGSSEYSDGGIYEYAHGGTHPINFLPLPRAVGCSVDPVTGNLVAVTFSDAVYVFQNAQGQPTEYVDKDIYYSSDVAYDNVGDLFVNGIYTNQSFALVELSSGSSTFHNINVPGGNYLGGANFEPILWDGQFLDLGSYQEVKQTRKIRTVINQLQISGSGATIVGTVALAMQARAEYPQFWIQGGVITQPSNKPKFDSYFETFKYPSGSPIKRVDLGRQDDVWGAVVSPAR